MKKKYSLLFAWFITSITLSIESRSEQTSENPAAQQAFPQIFSPPGDALEEPYKALQRMKENPQYQGERSEADPITGTFTPPYKEPSHLKEDMDEAWKTTKEKLHEFFVGTPKKSEDKDDSKKPVAIP